MSKKKKLKTLVAVNIDNSQKFTLIRKDSKETDTGEYLIPAKFSKLINRFTNLRLIPDSMTIIDNVFTIIFKPDQNFDEILMGYFMEYVTSNPSYHVRFQSMMEYVQNNIIYGATTFKGDYKLIFDFNFAYPTIGTHSNMHLFGPLYVHNFMSDSIKKMLYMINEAETRYKKSKKKFRKQ